MGQQNQMIVSHSSQRYKKTFILLQLYELIQLEKLMVS